MIYFARINENSQNMFYIYKYLSVIIALLIYTFVRNKQRNIICNLVFKLCIQQNIFYYVVNIFNLYCILALYHYWGWMAKFPFIFLFSFFFFLVLFFFFHIFFSFFSGFTSFNGIKLSRREKLEEYVAYFIIVKRFTRS